MDKQKTLEDAKDIMKAFEDVKKLFQSRTSGSQHQNRDMFDLAIADAFLIRREHKKQKTY